MCLKHISHYASFRGGFFHIEVGYPNLCNSCIFCLVSPIMVSFFLCEFIFLTQMPLAMMDFLLYGLGFIDLCVLNMFYLMSPTIMGFILYKKGFPDSHVSEIFYLVPLVVVGSLLMRVGFS